MPPGGLDPTPFPAPRWILLVSAAVLIALAAWVAVVAAFRGSLLGGLSVAAIFATGGGWLRHYSGLSEVSPAWQLPKVGLTAEELVRPYRVWRPQR